MAQFTNNQERKRVKHNKIGNVVFPGDTFTIEEGLGRNCKTRIGVGLTPSLIEKQNDNYNNNNNNNNKTEICEAIQVTRAGVLQSFNAMTNRPSSIKYNNNNNNSISNKMQQTPKIWIQNNQKKYIPRMDDRVIGVITHVSKDYYKVDINSPTLAILGNLEFEGATKRNRPELQIGDLIFARVLEYMSNMEPILTCKSGNILGSSESNNNKSWVTGESIFMQLKGGYCFNTSINWCFKLNRYNSQHLIEIGKFFPFECAIGINGKIWIKTSKIGQSILIANALQNGQFMDINDFKIMLHSLLNKFGITGNLQAKKIEID